MAFSYVSGVLTADGVPLDRLAEAVGTPVYVYAASRLRANYQAYARAFARDPVDVCFALKANSNQSIISLFARFGAGADVVSEGEMRRALAAGVPPEKVVFSGVGKTRDELAAALVAGIHQINVESLPELEALSAVATALGRTAPVALRINPDVDAGTHGKIATGRKEDKFGIDLGHAVAAYAKACSLPGLAPKGYAVHIGSQLLNISPYDDAYGHLSDLVIATREAGLKVERLDLGGGLGVPYQGEAAPDHDAYAGIVRKRLGNLGCRLTLEPGRSLVGDAGVLLARVIYVKEGLHRCFLIVDAAMNDLMRPTLYDAYHGIRPVLEPAADAPLSPMDVVGPICETGDTFARQRPLPPVAQGELVAFMTAGAYGAAMSSTYNSRPLVAEVLVDEGQWAVIRRRQTFEEMLALDVTPQWRHL
ncbi:diaminopimelate decarboxylase [Nitrospirillum pindoramense]|uniref:Diaminopimelate decarboxylase n=1 Tax=Nitrospirillum amazonense TaxID=28077 RepID=A0A560H5R9_9PROT|nr:diaminopimelate decarboxylase [Nitrospirillum amazonense]TWB41656.1 diaminopimelate decarboxylase [Nitrospirillum amazonense]